MDRLSFSTIDATQIISNALKSRRLFRVMVGTKTNNAQTKSGNTVRNLDAE
jgi:hypothetical protein